MGSFWQPAFLLGPSMAWAAPDPAGPVPAPFGFEQWGVEDGLPQSSVTGIAVGPTHLFVGTFGGAARFDGVDFQPIPVGEEGVSIRVTAVAASKDGEVVVGTQFGQVAAVEGTRLGRPRFTHPDRAPVRDLLFDERGELWVATDDELWHERGADRWSSYPVPSWQLETVSGGVAVVGAQGFALVVDGQVRREPMPVPSTTTDVARDGDRLWIALEHGIVVRLADGATHVVSRHEPSGDPKLLVDRASRLWLANDASVALLGETDALLAAALDGTDPAPPSRWPAPEVRTLQVDHEGSVWVGTNRGGLIRIVPQPFERVGVAGLDRAVQVVDADERGAWLAPLCRGFVHVARGRATEVIASDAPSPRCVNATLRDRYGRRLVSRERQLVDEARPERPLVELPSNILSIAQDGEGTFFLGTERDGAFAWRDDERPTPVDGVSDSPIADVAVAPDGSVWFTQPVGVRILHPGRARATGLGRGDGFPAAESRALLFDERGVAWVGTYGGGLVRVDRGRASLVTRRQGLAEDVVSALVDDGEGHLWMNGNRGVFRASYAELDRSALDPSYVLRSQRFATGEGNGGSSPSAARGPDGSLWFATIHGPVRFPPDRDAPNLAPPQVSIEFVRLNGVEMPPSGGWTAEPGTREIEIRYAAALLRDPQLARFATRLMPLEHDWRPAEAQRAIRYAHLPPGAYRFEVRAENDAGVWSEAEALEFVLAPYLTERPSFRLALGLLALIVLAGAARLWTRGQAHRAAALQQEIDQRARIEADLRTNEAYYRSVFRSASDGLLVTDALGRVVDANQAAEAMFGAPSGGLLGRTSAELLRPVSRTGDPDDTVHVANLGVRPDGGTFPVRVSTVALPAERALTSVVDLQPTIDLQRQLANAQRLEAIGRLAAGIAHDFNNLLTVVRANASSLRGQSRPIEPGIAESLDQIEDASKKGSELTRQLLAFGQKQVLRPQNVDFGELIRTLGPMLARVGNQGQRLVLTVGEGRCVARVDGTQLERVLLNLYMNALHATRAMGADGSVEIAVHALDAAEAVAQWPELPGGTEGWVLLSVTDNGTGIEPDVLPHLFEPFFTTKQAEGSGLGLASVHGFVTQSHGSVFVRSAPGEGARFDVLLPQAPRDADITPAPARRAAAGRANGATVLLVDDEALVRRTIERVLRSAGFVVLATDNAASALELLASRPVDLLVTDVQMPKVSGVDLARTARQRHPALRVVFVSGYTDEVISDELDGVLVHKPFDPAKLVEAVTRSLAGRGGDLF